MLSRLFLLLTIVVGFVAAEVPPYIHICGIKNPNLDDCIIKSVAILSKKIAGGIPELDVPGTDPMLIGDMVLIDTTNFKATGSDVTLSGLLTYHINSFHLDLEKQQVDFDLNLAEAKINGNYNISARILIPINGRGPLTFTTNDVNAKIRMLYNLVEHAGKQYVYFSSITTHLDIKDYTIKYEPENFDQTLRDAFRDAVGHNNREILEVTRPNLEKAISQKCLEISNKICKHFSYDELLPDRE
ncbi:circadian clock-controlled protein daywake [Bombus fervidus]|uniref:circadian clock-controlled protein daywake n=1 Tax=Bombus fervidus TaxID=203811 RepID=UPI003AB40A00